MRGHNTRPHARLMRPTFLGMDATKRSFDLQATWVVDVFYLFFDMSPIGVCTIEHWHVSGRLVHELNACTVGCDTEYYVRSKLMHGFYLYIQIY